jgi:hypothetical protein
MPDTYHSGKNQGTESFDVQSRGEGQLEIEGWLLHLSLVDKIFRSSSAQVPNT